MYRLIKMSGLKTATASIQVPSLSRQFCTFCRHMGVFPTRNVIGHNTSMDMESRFSSTSTNTALINELKKRRKFRKHKKKYAELLEVYGNSTTETKATVRNLRPEHINLLAQSPNITLEHLHEIKKNCQDSKTQKKISSEQNRLSSTSNTLILDSSINLKAPSVLNTCQANDIYEVLEDMQEEPHTQINSSGIFTTLEDSEIEKEILNEINLQIKDDKDSVFAETEEIVKNEEVKHQRLSSSMKKQTKEKLAKIKITQLEKEGREKSFNAILLAYLQLCESCGYLNRGMVTLQHYLNRGLYGNATKVSDVRIFHVLMQGYALKGNIVKVEELLKLMNSVNVKSTPQAYAALIECVARSGEIEEKQKIEKYTSIMSNMEEDGFSLNDLFESCVFVGNQRQVILDAIREIEPSFKPELAMQNLCYSCSLLHNIHEGKNNLNSPIKGLLSREELQTLTQEQLSMELASCVKIKTIEKRPTPTPAILAYRQKLEKLTEVWSEAIDKGFQRDLTAMGIINQNLKKCRYLNIYPYLKVLEPHQYRDIILQEVRKMAEGSETFSPSVNKLYSDLANQVRTRFIIKYKKTHGILAKTQQIYSEYLDWYMDPKMNNSRSRNGRQEWQQLLHEHQEGPTITIDEHFWPAPVLSGVGKFLYNLILRDIKVDVNCLQENSKPHMLPAFYSLYRQSGHKSLEEVKPHPVLSRLYRLSAQEDLLFHVSEVPMVVPPIPWTSVTSGGNMIVKTDIIRLPPSAVLQKERLKAAPPDQLYPPLDSLNQLGAVPWKVNQPVLDTVIEVFNNGGNTKLDIPQPPSICPLPTPITPDMTKPERYAAYRQRMLLRRRKAEMYSLWCDALYRLSLGNHFRDRIFWLPHNMDFRGRVYPCPPHLNHLGADMARALLCFARGEPLGPSGLDWLKMHLVNLTGLKKRDTVSDRLKFANKIMDDIIDSADKPLTGRMWWSKSEEPWQTLACCKEIAAATRHPEGPENYICYYPVHQDGSCNGLQHYAALGRDEAGAFSVNLLPAESPQDVYSCVAAIVERERIKDADNGVLIAKILDGFVRRKVIKQTVMTTVYGVTRFGARLQIAKQLKDIDSFPKEHVWAASAYLVVKTFESIREMFTSTREIQDWFTECARLISQICGQNVEYVTPLGLPVVQPYIRSTKKLEMHTNQLGRIQENYAMDMCERPNVMKQKNAFPPNFIHSLDSSHMMLTSLHCEQRGITYVSVHDCYWTHPNTVQIMNQICREQFVALHSERILEDLSVFMIEKYSYNDCNLPIDGDLIFKSKSKLNEALKKVPRKGDLRLENVLDSVYFFS